VLWLDKTIDALPSPSVAKDAMVLQTGIRYSFHAIVFNIWNSASIK
jgi:hypothetical protein